MPLGHGLEFLGLRGWSSFGLLREVIVFFDIRSRYFMPLGHGLV